MASYGLILVAKIFCFVTLSAYAQDFSGKVVGVTDGDNITVLRINTPVDVRLNGIDAPEPGQPYGERAKQFVSALCFGDYITVRISGLDKYGRTLGDVILGDGRILNEELLRAGMAWHYVNYSADEGLAEIESKARLMKIGLWSDPLPVAPWEWRLRASGVSELAGQKLGLTSSLGGPMVYITVKGKKYHSENCRFLRKSRIPISLAAAQAKGYGPCSVCNPCASNTGGAALSRAKASDPGNQTVYVIRTGSKYHKAGCRHLRRSAIPMKLKDAAINYAPCSVCKPPKTE